MLYTIIDIPMCVRTSTFFEQFLLSIISVRLLSIRDLESKSSYIVSLEPTYIPATTS